MSTSNDLAASVRDTAKPLFGQPADYDPLLELIGDARIVLIGEASHGTHEFYRQRAEITKRLIAEKAFSAVAVEADWPDAYRINRYVRGAAIDRGAEDALGGFKRFPAWMWRNTDVLEFVNWLRAYNDREPSPESRVGFYGLDLYSLRESIRAVLEYLDKVDPDGARRARYRYSCFDQFGEDTQAYGYAAAFELGRSCEEEVTRQLTEMSHRALDYARQDGRLAADEQFFAEQNARLVKNAEEYYRSMFGSRRASWNNRDRHMADTLEHLASFLRLHSRDAKIVVWAHNSHVGNARATEMGDDGEINIGSLVRERYKQQAVLIGFTTFSGTVTAASEWDAPPERKRVRPALENSYEWLFHQTRLDRLFLDLRDCRLLALRERRLERAIGVIYRPTSERISHYFLAALPEQFDAVLHFDHTSAVEPLECAGAQWHGEPETYPTGV